jgi:leader peptidase (prepilin peptidase)/N-methyltransferase
VRYPLVEVSTALLFVALALAGRYTPLVDTGGIVWQHVPGFLFQAAFVAMLVASTCIDVAHRILPDAITKPGMALGIAGAFVVPGLAGRFEAPISPAMSSVLYSACGAAVGMGATWLVRILARAAFRKEALGLGDVKFLGMIGAFVGWQGALLTFFLASLTGAVGGLVHRWLTKDAYVPFGPFLALGALLTLFFAGPILRFLFVTWPEWQYQSPMASWLLSAAAVLSILVLMILVRRGRGTDDPR